VVGLVQAALAAAKVELPEDIARGLAETVRAGQRRGLALAAESHRLQQLLAAAGIASRIVKGAPLAQLAYGTQVLKIGRDVDLLVLPGDATAAWRLLEADGYRPVPPLGELTAATFAVVRRCHKDVELRHPARRVTLELHWRLVDNPALLAGITAASPAERVAVMGLAIETLAARELFAYLCVHGASHAWFRVKWLADLNAWLAGKSEASLIELYRHAEAEGVGACAASALLLCRRLLNLKVPAELAPAMRRARPRRLAALALDAMAGAGGEVELARRPFGPFRLIPTQFLRGQGVRFFLAQLAMMTDSLDDRLAVPLPPALHGLYPLLRLPLWIGRSLARRLRRRPADQAVAAAGQGRAG
jgi:hypothetical protein